MAAYRTDPKEVTNISQVLKADVLDLALGSNHCIALAAKNSWIEVEYTSSL